MGTPPAAAATPAPKVADEAQADIDQLLQNNKYAPNSSDTDDFFFPCRDAFVSRGALLRFETCAFPLLSGE